jgi:hypothetical protein
MEGCSDAAVIVHESLEEVGAPKKAFHFGQGGRNWDSQDRFYAFLIHTYGPITDFISEELYRFDVVPRFFEFESQASIPTTL